MKNRETTTAIGAVVALALMAGGVAASFTTDSHDHTAAAPPPVPAPSLAPMSAAAYDAQHNPTTTTTTAPPATTTTHTHPPRTTTTQRASRGNAPRTAPEVQSTGDVRKVSSTAYCLTSKTANGERGYDGSVAMNGVPFGSLWRVQETGRVYRVNDRIGHSSQFDVWVSSCDYAIEVYGRRSITIERVG